MKDVKTKRRGRGFSKKNYAFYKDDELIVIGTIKEIADFCNYKLESLYVIRCRANNKNDSSFKNYHFVEV